MAGSEEEDRKHVYALATKWSIKDPQAIIDKILWIEGEARVAEQNWPRWTNYLLTEMSKLVDSPKDWAEWTFDRTVRLKWYLHFLRERRRILKQGGSFNPLLSF